jgi:hypothetical protein
VIERARGLGAFRFNTGRLMRIGTAARQWNKLEPTEADWQAFRKLLTTMAARLAGEMEVCHVPFSIEEGLERSLETPPATLLVLPTAGSRWPRAASHLRGPAQEFARRGVGGLPQRLEECYSDRAAREAMDDRSHHAQANTWRLLPAAVA